MFYIYVVFIKITGKNVVHFSSCTDLLQIVGLTYDDRE